MKLFIVLALAAFVYTANGASLNKRDLRDDLLAKAEALEKQAAAAIKKLDEEGRRLLAAGIEREEKRLQTLAAELKAATGEAAIRRLETEVRAVETRLAEEIRLAERGTGRPTTSTTAASVFKRDVRDDLLARAADLEKEAAAEVQKLRTAGHTAAAAAIEREEKRLQALATELKAATGEAAITRLEAEVRAIERRIDEEIHRAEGSSRPPRPTRPSSRSTQAATTTAASVFKRDVRDDLLAKAEALEKQAAAAIKKLDEEGRRLLAAGIEREEKRLQTLAAELKAATGEAAIRRLETEVRAVETRLAEEIRLAERGTGRPTTSTTAASVFKRDVRDDLLARAADLEKEAAAEVQKLRAAGHTAAAAAIEREEKRLQALATELKAATGEAAITRLEAEVRAIERRIDEEIHRAEGSSRPPRPTRPSSRSTQAATTTVASVFKRDVRDDLLARAADLEKEAAAEVQKLRAAGHTAAAAAIEREEKRLQALATELKAATGEAAITRLEAEVRAIERRIDEEIHRAEGSSRPPRPTRPSSRSTQAATTTAASVFKRDVRDDLLARAADLEKEAAAEVQKLRTAGHTAAAAAIEREEKRLQALATELKAATGEAAITRLEAEVRAIERRIDEEIHRAEGSSRPPRPTRPSSRSTQAASTTAASF